MPKVVIVDGFHYPAGTYDDVAALCQSQNVEFEALDCKSPADVVRKAADADVLIDIFIHIDGTVLSQLPRCRLIVRHGIGLDVLNVEDCTEHGVIVCNVPDFGVEEVAVHALALLLALERKIAFYGALVRSGEWDESPGYEMRRLSERVLGFIGFGRIAVKMATFLKPLGYELLAFDPFLPAEAFAKNGVTAVDLDELFSRADVIVPMAPNTPETRNVVSASRLQKAKDGLLIVNTAMETTFFSTEAYSVP